MIGVRQVSGKSQSALNFHRIRLGFGWFISGAFKTSVSLILVTRRVSEGQFRNNLICGPSLTRRVTEISETLVLQASLMNQSKSNLIHRKWNADWHLPNI